MVQAYVLIRIVPGKLAEALGQIQKTPGVKMAHAVTGPTDIIAFVETESMDTLGRLIVSRFQETPGVTRTTTCVVTPVSGT
ncbi:MAG: Lrp/AsnC ligand binding domain-containing protein [Armatimonadetes bacterium]|nr:Lrp/AsnC ligand binding domain-containing protein [Armatimonadota bacterium]